MDPLHRLGHGGRGLRTVPGQGQPCVRPGPAHTLRWQDAATGERHARVEIVLDNPILLDRWGGASVAAPDDGDAVPF